MTNTETMPVRRTARYTAVTLPDEIDIANADHVREGLLNLINADGPVTRPLIVDMTETSFCDSSGVNAVLRGHTRADAMGRRMYLAILPGGITRKIFDITAVSRLIPVHDDVGSAIAAAVVAAFDRH
ncbi:STAS domain-containing protein [Actinomadura sp. DC4]|uniref:STAS domain-containing protein n=1 Tax=Actinomadura sp. DC4 TaxID=3055069 RepID=UPI0025B0543C|nr:STAS domain-containing protein [Actinomadura sp. DC4]MDN3353597.1 STAS domain-containing protein [Actinomadura sp. DC4]